MLSCLGFAIVINRTIYLTQDYEYAGSNHVYLTYITNTSQEIYDSNKEDVIMNKTSLEPFDIQIIDDYDKQVTLIIYDHII